MVTHIHPRPLPQQVLDDPERRAEVKVYRALEERLSGEHAVYYSVNWLGRPHAEGRPIDGEVDFVVAHPRRGLLVLEVKGGGIRRDGESGAWSSIGASGAEHHIRDPYEQAKLGKIALLRRLEGVREWRNRPLVVGHAVVFPDAGRNPALLGADADRHMTAFAEDLPHLDLWVERALAFYQGDSPTPPAIGGDGMDLLDRLLAPVYTLRRPLSAELAEAEERIVRLTASQMRTLDLLSRQRRVEVAGGAGTGKTMLAMEKARRLAAEGFRTLLTCYNKGLSRHLRETLGPRENLVVSHFHELAYELGREAKVEGVRDPEAAPSSDLTAYFCEEMPRILISAMERLPERRFDAIVVDEGQDFQDEWWTALQLCLTHPDDGILYVFHDDNQRVFSRSDRLPEGLAPANLADNLRNTVPIHAEAARRWQGGAGSEYRAAGPEGRPVERASFDGTKTLRKEVSRALHRLLIEERLPPEQVAVLVGDKSDLGVLLEGDRIGSHLAVQGTAGERGRVRIATVRSFKGLESPVVVLVLRRKDLASDELVYTGVTRARSHLVMVEEGPAQSGR